MPRSLVTGVAGFIGSHVAECLLRLGHVVVGLDDLSGGRLENVPERVHFIRGNVANSELVRHLFVDKHPDYVYHLAAYAAEGLSPFIRAFNYQNNIVGSAVLISAAIEYGIRRFIFTSSIAVYGDQEAPFDESFPKRPIDPYGLAKAVIEDDLELAHRQFGLSYTIFRPHNVYGERQNINDPYRNVVGIFIRQSLDRQPLTVFGSGEQTRAFSHIDDVAPVIAECIEIPESENGVFNIGNDEVYSVIQLARMVASSLQEKCSLVHLAARHEVGAACCRHDRFRQVFGNRPRIPLEEGITRMTNWARRHGRSLPTPRPCPIEVHRDFPDSWRELDSAQEEMSRARVND